MRPENNLSDTRGAYATPLAMEFSLWIAIGFSQSRFYGNWLPGDSRGFVARARDVRP